jgi:O-acetylserine/cysteine efflux transporter
MTFRDALLAILVAVIWGFNFVAIRAGLQDMPPLLLVVVRFVIAAVPVFVLPRPAIPLPRMLSLGATLFIGQFGLLFTGMAVGMPPGLASVTLTTQVFFTVLMAAVVLGERPTLQQGIGILVACFGLAAVATTVGSYGVTAAGLVLTLGAALSWAAGNVLLRGVGTFDPLALMVWLSLIPPLPMLGLACVVDGPAALLHALAATTWLGYAAVLYIGVVSTLVGYGIWGLLLRHYAAITVAPFALLVPVVGVVSSALLYGERFGPRRLVGMILILSGLAVVALPMHRR